MRLKVVVVLAVVLVMASPAFAFPILGLQANELDVNASIMVIGSSPPAGYGQGTTIVTLIGASLPIKLQAPFFIEPDIELFGWPYAWANTRAVPTSSEDGKGFFVLGMLVGLQGGISYPVSSALTLGGSIGLDLLLRIPIELQNTGIASQIGSAMGYFYGGGRFFYPETRFFLRWHISDPIELVFNLRAWYPVFHFWDGEALPFIDQLMVSAGIGIGINLQTPPELHREPRAEEPPAEEKPATPPAAPPAAPAAPAAPPAN